MMTDARPLLILMMTDACPLLIFIRPLPICHHPQYTGVTR